MHIISYCHICTNNIYIYIYIYIYSINLHSFRSHQYTSDQKKFLKDQIAQTTARVVSVEPFSLYIYIYICILKIILYIYFMYINYYIYYIYKYIYTVEIAKKMITRLLFQFASP